MGKFSGILICTDFDGTISISHEKVVDKNKDAIKYFTDNGGLFSVISGRGTDFIEKLREEIGYNTYVGSVNGSVIYDVPNHKIVAENLLVITNIVPRLKKVIQSIPNVKDLIIFGKEESITLNPLDEDFDELLINAVRKPTYKFLIHGVNHFSENDVQLVSDIMGGSFEISRSWAFGIEGQTAGVNKGYAAKKIAMLSNAKLLVCVGDYENDIPMICKADIGYAVSNAIPSLKEVADRITVDVKDGAIAAVIQDLDREF